jgi:hypothetical protein
MSKRYPGGIIRKTPQTPTQTSAQGIWDMASVTQAVKENTWPIAGVPDPISKSLRFRSSASAYLNRTPASAGNRQTWTWSGWVKRGSLGGDNSIFTAYGNGTQTGGIYFSNDTVTDALEVRFSFSGGWTGFLVTSQVFRDPSAWYHIVFAADTTQATSTNRLKLYVNGVQVTAFQSSGYPAQNTDGFVNQAQLHEIGRLVTSNAYLFDGYMAECYFIDGQALTPSSFGNTNDQTGVWQPIAYTGTYGTNGFYLPFSNTASTSTLGNDFSGNSNNWTTNNISLTSGSTYDSMVDVPTQWIPYNTAGDTGALWRGNYCVLNSLNQNSAITLSAGNLSFTASNNRFTTSTFAVTSGKWYWEFYPVAGGASGVGVGAILATTYVFGTAGFANGAGYTGVGYTSNGNKYISGTSSAYGATYGSGNVIGVALDLDSGTKTITFYKDNTSQGSINLPTSSEAWIVATDYSEAGTHSINFGQRPFSYTPPSGFKTLNTTNLPTPTIGATASTTANEYFDVSLYTGNGSNPRAITGLGFQPDFVWLKNRSAGWGHRLSNAVVGANYALESNNQNAELFQNQYGYLTSFNSDGFTVTAGSTDDYYTNNSGEAYVAWQWKANGTGSSNTQGSITSTVSANTTAGFSVVTYTGNGSNATIGHGLGVAPSMIIRKARNASLQSNWYVYHQSSSANGALFLNLTDAYFASANYWNNTAPTSTVFSVGSATNVLNDTWVAYCFAQVAGYSAFGSYTGNASTDGPFVFTGFRPRFIMTKNASASGSNWSIQDTSRPGYNVTDNRLFPNSADAETSNGDGLIDINSNGFKIRTSHFGMNGSGNTIIYMAFAESPFKFSLAR